MIGAIRKSERPRIHLPMPHSGQKAIRLQARRFNWLCAGRRWRKTTMVMSIAVESAIARQPILWGAPTFDQVRIGFEETKRAAYGIADFNESRMTARFPGGGIVSYRSLDNPDNVRGHTANGVVIDEVQDVKSVAYHEVLRPMLMDMNGWFWGIGTSGGKDWFWKERQNARFQDNARAWRVPTLGVEITEEKQLVRKPHPLENPNISFDEIRILFETLPEYIFRREILSDDEAHASGLVFDVWLDNYPEAQDGNVTEESEYIAGAGPIIWLVDDGYAGIVDPHTGMYTADSHPRAILLVQLKPDGHYDVFAEDYAIETLSNIHIARVKALPYPAPDYAIRGPGTKEIKGQLFAQDIYSRQIVQEVEETIKEGRNILAPDKNGWRRLRVHPRCVHLRSEMGSYRKDSVTGKVVKEFDHGPDCIRYLAWDKRHG